MTGLHPNIGISWPSSFTFSLIPCPYCQYSCSGGEDHELMSRKKHPQAIVKIFRNTCTGWYLVAFLSVRSKGRNSDGGWCMGTRPVDDHHSVREQALTPFPNTEEASKVSCGHLRGYRNRRGWDGALLSIPMRDWSPERDVYAGRCTEQSTASC